MKDRLTYFEELCELKYSGSTPKNYVHHVRLLFDFTGHEKMTQRDVVKYNLHIRNKSYSYRNVAINAFRAYFKLMLQKELTGIAKIRPPKQNKKPTVYDCNEMAERIHRIENIKHRAMLALALCCWLRKSELLNLKIADINGSLRQIHIKNSKGCKDRVIPISIKTLEILRKYYREHRPKDYLFEGQNGGRYSPTSVDKITKKYLFPKMRFHQIRASAATYALANGTDLKTVSEILGHSKIQTTEHYIPVLYENVRTAI